MARLALNTGEDGGCFRVLSEKGRSQGFISYEELIKCIKSRGIIDQDQIDDIVEMILDMGINVANRPE